MPGEREEMMNELTGNEPGNTNPPADPPAPAEPAAADPPKPDAAPEQPPSPTGGKDTLALLDSLTEGGEPVKPADPAVPVAKDAPAEPGKEPPKPDAEPPKAKTLDEQEAEALENVKSERGQERIKAVFAERRALESEKQALQQDIDDFRGLVTATGMDAAEFTQMLEVGRLIKAGDEASLRSALGVIDQQRTMLYKQLGVEAPGVDPLSDFPDLKQQVDNMEITKEAAHQLARFKRQEQVNQQRAQQEQAQQQNMAAFQQQLQQASQTAESYFKTREKEVDYPSKMKVITERFKNPAYIQEFVQTYEPRQWFSVLRMMYDGIQVQAPATPPRANEQPLRPRGTHTGASVANTNVDLSTRIGQHMDSLGL